MITILLKQIIDLLTGWISSFTQYASDVLEKLGLIEEDTSYLPDIKSDCDDIKDNTAAVITPINNIKSNTDSINTSSATTASNTTAIMNQAVTIGTNSGRAAAFAEDCANNTLDIKDKVVTIASDTTQIRANGNTLVTDIAEIKDLLQYYFLTNIVTEEIEDDLCNLDTDLEDYLQKAVVTIPVNAGGYSSIDIIQTNVNLWDEEWEQGGISSNGGNTSSTTRIRSKNYIVVKPNKNYYFNVSNSAFNCIKAFYDETKTFISTAYGNGNFTTPANAYYMRFSSTNDNYGGTYNNDLSINYPNTDTAYESNRMDITQISLGTTVTDGAELDLLSGLLKINTTPATYAQLTPIVIRTYKGVNNIYSNIGSMDVIYRETLKHYLDKNNQ